VGEVVAKKLVLCMLIFFLFFFSETRVWRNFIS
jgi:hypothetical protein